MLNYLVEFVGTFVFLSVILNSAFGKLGESGLAAVPIGLALMVAIFFGGNVSGGHYNPAVSTMMLLGNKMSSADFLPYVVAQVLGGLVALRFYNQTTQ